MKEIKYKAIYKCRWCKKEFDGEAHMMDGSEYPTASLCKQHKCSAGVYGVADLQAVYEV